MACLEPPRRIYHPSVWELAWKARVTAQPDSTKFWLRHCSVLRNETSLIEHWMELGTARTASGPHALARSERIKWNDSIISFHTVVDRCSDSGSSRAVGRRIPIEPLISFLRHPRHTCFNKLSYKYERSYLVPMRAAEHVPSPPEQRCLFFDLGASLYSFGTGGASLQWFVELCKCARTRLDPHCLSYPA